METPQTKPKSTATILRRLADFAERHNLSSNQAMLIYMGNAGFLNLEMTQVAINILQKLAGEHGIDLYEEQPFIIQLIKKGVISAQEVEIFGYRTKETEGQTEKNSTTGAAVAIGPNGNRARSV